MSFFFGSKPPDVSTAPDDDLSGLSRGGHGCHLHFGLAPHGGGEQEGQEGQEQQWDLVAGDLHLVPVTVT